MSDEAIGCRWCPAFFEGPDRRERYRVHLAEEHPSPPMVTVTSPVVTEPEAAVLDVPKEAQVGERRRWSAAETEKIRAEYAAKGPRVLAQEMGRTERSLMEKAGKLGVRPPPGTPRKAAGGGLVKQRREVGTESAPSTEVPKSVPRANGAVHLELTRAEAEALIEAMQIDRLVADDNAPVEDVRKMHGRLGLYLKVREAMAR